MENMPSFLIDIPNIEPFPQVLYPPLEAYNFLL